MDFKNTIIILTSNLGSQYLLDGIDANGEISEAGQEPGGRAAEALLPSGISEPSGRDRVLQAADP